MPEANTNSQVSTPRKYTIANGDILGSPQKLVAAQVVKQFSYDVKDKGWIRCVAKLRSSTNLSTFKKLCDKRNQQKTNMMRSQKYIDVNNRTNSSGKQSISQRCSSFYLRLNDVHVNQEEEEEEEAEKVQEVGDLEDLINEEPDISTPFTKCELSKQLAFWKTPENPPKAFDGFKKPSNEKFSSFTSSEALVERLKRELREKEKQVVLLQKQLWKIHKESSVLAEQVATNHKPESAALYRENHALKDKLEKCMKENSVLKGLHMQSTNSALLKLREREQLKRPDSDRQLSNRARSAPHAKDRVL